MGDSGGDGSQGFHNGNFYEANGTDIIREEKQMVASTSSTVVADKEDFRDGQIAGEKGFADVDPKLTQSEFLGRVTGISMVAKDVSMDVDVTVSGFDQFTSWEDSIVVGAPSDYSMGEVSLVSSTMSDPTRTLAGYGSAEEFQIHSSSLDLDQASLPGSSLVSAPLFHGREKTLPDAQIRGLTTAEIWEIGGEDVGLQRVRNDNTDQASLKAVTTDFKGSMSCVVQDRRATQQCTQETDFSGCLAPVMPVGDTRGIGLAGASTSFPQIGKDNNSTANEEKDQEVNDSRVHDAVISLCEHVIVPTQVSERAGQDASTALASVRDVETENASDAATEREFLGKSGHGHRVVEGSEGTAEFQSNIALGYRAVSGDGKKNVLPESVVEAIAVDEAARCGVGSHTPGHFTAVEARDQSMSTSARVKVIISSVEESTKAGFEADCGVDTSAGENTVKQREVDVGMSESKASERNEDDRDFIMGEPVVEEAVSREEERDDIVMEYVTKEESSGLAYPVEGSSRIAEGLSRWMPDGVGERLESVEDSIERETRTVGTIGLMTESDLDIVKNLVTNICREVSAKNELLSSDQNTTAVDSPDLGASGFDGTDCSSFLVAQKHEVPPDGVVKCENERKWKKLILHGLELLTSVAAVIELKQKDALDSVRGGTELDVSDEYMLNRIDDSPAQTMEAQAGPKSEVAISRLSEVPKTEYLVVTTEVGERRAVAGISSRDVARSLGMEMLAEVKPSDEVCGSEEPRGLENALISRGNSEELQQADDAEAGCLAESATGQAEVGGGVTSPVIAVNAGFEIDTSVLHGAAEEEATGKKDRKDFVDGSPALRLEKFLQKAGLISDSEFPLADKAVGITGDQGINCPEHCDELAKRGSGIPGFCSSDLQGVTCSFSTKIPVPRVETPDEIFDAAVREPSGVQPVVRVEKVLAVSAHDTLPVAIRTLPVVPNKEASPQQAVETTFLTSYAFGDRKGHASIQGASKVLAEYEERECTGTDELDQEKSEIAGMVSGDGFSPASCKQAEGLSGAGLEICGKPGIKFCPDPSVSRDVALTHVDALNQIVKDSINTPTIHTDSAEDTQQLLVNEGGSVSLDADGTTPTVAVKKKLQTKRKKVAEQTVETEKQQTEAATFGAVRSSPWADVSGPVVEDVTGIHGSADAVTILDDTRVSHVQAETSAADQAVVLWLPDADGVEGSPTVLTNGDQTHAHALRCDCGKPAVLKTVGYKSRNKGLRYYSCEEYKPTFFTRKRSRKRDSHNLTSCRFFRWLDSPRVTMEDKKEIRLRKRRQLEQILTAKAVTCNYSTRSSSKHEFSVYDAPKNQALLEGVPPLSGLSVEEPKHENSEELKPSVKKQKPNKMDPSLSTADSVAFSTRASAARKRKGQCCGTNDQDIPANSSCGNESSHEVSVGDWTDSHPGKVAKKAKSEADTPAHTYSRRPKLLRLSRRSAYLPRAKSIGKLERATADTDHVRKLLPVSLAYEKSREVVLEESSKEEVSDDQREKSIEKENFLEESSAEKRLEKCTSAQREQTPVKSRRQIASRTGQNGTHTKSSGELEGSKRALQRCLLDASGSETALSKDLHKKTNQPPQWVDVPLTCPFENKESSKSGVSGQEAVQHKFGEYGSFAVNYDVVVKFPTGSQSRERRTASSNTVLLVKEKAREASFVNLRRGKGLTKDTELQRVPCTKPADRSQKRSERLVVPDSDEEKTGPRGSRGLRSLMDMLKRENSDGTVADYEVANESQPPYCECKTVKRRAALKTVLSNSPNYGLRYWVCVNHRPLFQKKSLWEGDPNDESCKFFRWLDTPIVSYAERKKKLAARRRRNERRRR